MLPKFKQIHDGDYDRLWLCREVVESDHPTHLVVQLQYTDEWGDFPHKYHIQVLAVGPQWVPEENLKDRLNSLGMTPEEFRGYSLEGQIHLLVETGTAAYLFQKSGDNWKKLYREAREEVQKMLCLFGFYMDRPQNAIGDTGWDWIRGDLCSFLKKEKAEA